MKDKSSVTLTEGEADIKFGSWSHKQFSPPVPLLTEPVRFSPADLLLQWMNPSASAMGWQMLWGAVELWGFQGASCSQAYAEESCERSLLHSIAFPQRKNKSFNTSTWEKNEALKLGKGLPISPQHFKTTAHHFCRRQCPAPAEARGTHWGVTLWEGPFAPLCAGWCTTLDTHTE